MNDNHSISSVSDLELLESGNLLIDETELKINNLKVTRRQFPTMDKKVVLIRPNPEDWTEADRLRVGSPTSLLAIASVLQKSNVPVEIIDFSVLTQEEEEECLNHLVIRDDMLIVGFSLMSVQIAHCLRIIRKLKEKQPKTKIIIGGIHAVLYPEETCEHELIDYVCYADGEDMMVDLVEFLNDGEEEYPEHVAALLYKKNGFVQKNPVGDLPEINDLPYSPYDLLDVERYVHRSWHPTDPSHKTRSFDILTGKG